MKTNSLVHSPNQVFIWHTILTLNFKYKDSSLLGLQVMGKIKDFRDVRHTKNAFFCFDYIYKHKQLELSKLLSYVRLSLNLLISLDKNVTLVNKPILHVYKMYYFLTLPSFQIMIKFGSL